jgi:hypothetical protein
MKRRIGKTPNVARYSLRGGKGPVRKVLASAAEAEVWVGLGIMTPSRMTTASEADPRQLSQRENYVRH